MRRNRRNLVLVVALCSFVLGAVSACSTPSPAPSVTPPPTTARPTPDVVGEDEVIPLPVGPPLRLSTKCGIQFLQTGEQWWETSPFGDGGPPPGWPSPYAKGVQLGGDMGDVLIFATKYEPDMLWFHLTTRTPPPCP